MMWTAWGVLGFFMILSNRWLKVYYRFYFWIHAISGTCILILTFVLGLIAMKEVGWVIDNYPHTYMGFIMLVLVGLLVIGGYFTRFTMLMFKWKTKKMLQGKMMHKVTHLFFILIHRYLDISCLH